MNRIILIGNGFDLAHKITTGYRDFIDDLWKDKFRRIEKMYKSRPGSFYGYQMYNIYEDDDDDIKIIDLLDAIQKKGINLNLEETPIEEVYNYFRKFIKFKNEFLGIISKERYKNWVDIEEVYYRELNEIYKKELSRFNIDDLNSEFKQIEKYLEEYLKKVESDFKINFKDDRLIKHITDKIYSAFKLKDLPDKFTNDKTNEIVEALISDIEGLGKNFSSFQEKSGVCLRLIIALCSYYKSEQVMSMPKSEIFKDVKQQLKKYDDNYKSKPNNILFLNFNYTHTEDFYLEKNLDNVEVIHIHGSLKKNLNNPIIFGYGDEIDKDYKNIENLNDNKFLENIKSVKYLETDNYKRLLDFVESDSYQVFLFGHSCGISDRTLLNTLFEHKNCHSIKPFYRIYKDNKTGEIKDDYSNLVRNITRNFNDKTLLREKVVNKKDCEPLVSLEIQAEQKYSFSADLEVPAGKE